MYGQPLMLDFHCAHGIRSIELPIGKAVSLEDEILPYAATHIVAWLKARRVHQLGEVGIGAPQSLQFL